MTPPLATSPAPRDLGALVTAVFERWRSSGVAFLILRNYEGLPQATTNDIDALVSPAQLALAERELVAAAQQAGYLLHNRAEFSPVSLFFHHPVSQRQIQFDLFHSLKWRGFTLLATRDVLARRIERGLFAIPHPAHEAVLNLITRQLYHGYVREKYKPQILAGVRQDPAAAKAALAEMFGAAVAKTLTRGVLEERWADVEQQTSAMRRQLIVRRVTRQPMTTLGSLLLDLGRFVRRLRRPPGILIVLLGADGSGKSTVGAQLVEALHSSFNREKTLRGHWKPALIRRRGRGEASVVTNPHGRAPRGRWGSLLALGCHWLEYLMGGGVQFLPVLFRNGMVLMDRYHYDFAVDPRRYRLQVASETVRAWFRWLPAPDLVFVLDAPTDVLRSRKQEVAAEETERQREAYRALARSLPNARIVDCAQPLDAVVRTIVGEVLLHLRERQARRMN
ncbi:MAG TPA: hypothetical protein VI136_24380 [Verrucomicrobiae bacterium]